MQQLAGVNVRQLYFAVSSPTVTAPCSWLSRLVCGTVLVGRNSYTSRRIGFLHSNKQHAIDSDVCGPESTAFYQEMKNNEA
eukprot:COSAG02_NODE_563_length_20290_cov_23.664108_9_plen_81_part_00